MNKIYQIYQVSDSTGETLDRIFSAIKAQFSNFNCKTIHHSFTRTKNQIDNIISKSDIIFPSSWDIVNCTAPILL